MFCLVSAYSEEEALPSDTLTTQSRHTSLAAGHSGGGGRGESGKSRAARGRCVTPESREEGLAGLQWRDWSRCGSGASARSRGCRAAGGLDLEMIDSDDDDPLFSGDGISGRGQSSGIAEGVPGGTGAPAEPEQGR